MSALAVAVALAGGPAASARASKAPTVQNLRHDLRAAKRSAKRYRHQRDTARRHSRSYERERDAARRMVTARDGTISQLRSQLASSNGQVSALQTEISSLRAGVPSAVAAIARKGNITDLFNLVIIPAHRAWMCGGSSYYGETFYEVDFDRLDSQGFCY